MIYKVRIERYKVRIARYKVIIIFCLFCGGMGYLSSLQFFLSGLDRIFIERGVKEMREFLWVLCAGWRDERLQIVMENKR